MSTRGKQAPAALPTRQMWPQRANDGYVMAALLVTMTVMSLAVSAALPIWHTAMRREREEELLFRGQQYVRAITLFQRRYAGTFPPSLDVLVDGRFLRRQFEDPITHRPFRLLYAGVPRGDGAQGAQSTALSGDPRRGIAGVASTSRTRSLRTFRQRNRYSEWLFVAGSEEPSLGLPDRARPVVGQRER